MALGETTLTISTILGRQELTGDRGPFLLASVQGIEGISMPFSYDLTLYRDMNAEDIDPSTLVNTGAKIGIRSLLRFTDRDARPVTAPRNAAEAL